MYIYIGRVYFNVLLHTSLPEIKGILLKYMPSLHQSVTMKSCVLDLSVISFSQPPNCEAVYVGLSSVNP